MTFEKNTNRIDSYAYYVMPHGRYKGMFLTDLYEVNNKYFLWIAERADGELRTAIEYVIGAKVSEEIEKNESRKRLSNRRKNKKTVSKSVKRVRKERRVGTKNNSGRVVLPDQLY